MFRILTLVVAVALSAAWASAESLGEVARRERERRASLGKHSRVLTNEDLKRPRILAPGPGKQVSRARRELMPLGDHTFSSRPPGLFSSRPPGLVADPRVPLWNLAEQPGFSLGDYARRLRALRADPGAGTQAAPQFANVPRPPFPAAPAPRLPAGLLPAKFVRRLKARRQRRRALVRPPNRPDDVLTSDPIRVRRGDSLSKLARVYLGDEKLWISLWEANAEVRDPHLIYPGQSLRWPEIPALARNEEPATEKRKLSAVVHALGAISVVHQPVVD